MIAYQTRRQAANTISAVPGPLIPQTSIQPNVSPIVLMAIWEPTPPVVATVLIMGTSRL